MSDGTLIHLDVPRSAGTPPPDNDSRLVFQCTGGALHTLVRGADRLLAADGGYQRGGLLVRVAFLGEPTTNDKTRREAGAVVIMRVEADYLAVRLTELARWQKPDRRSKEPRYIDAPPAVARGVMAMAGEWSAPVLTGVTEAPMIRPDGSVLSTPGYDRETGVYYADGGLRLPPIPAEPSRDDALAALRRLRDVIGTFPFVDEDGAADGGASRSAMLAAMLTPFLRRWLPTAPMFVISAPAAGSGKGLLADVVALLATGRRCAVLNHSRDPEAERKALFSALIAGDSVLHIDNIERDFGGEVLCSILTSAEYQDRVLGVSKMARAPTNITLLASGNNITIRGDMTRRVVPVRIDPRCDRPDEREFPGDLRANVQRRRPELVAAAITVLRAYAVAGRPPQPIKPYGSFEAWSDWVRSALVWLGEPDPLGNRGAIESADPQRSCLRDVLLAWRGAFGGAWLTAKEVMAALHGDADIDDAAKKELAAALELIPRGRAGLTTYALSGWLRASKDRVMDGMVFRHSAGRSNTSKWAVGRLDGGDGGTGGCVLLNVGEVSENDKYIKGGGASPSFPPSPPPADADEGAF